MHHPNFYSSNLVIRDSKKEEFSFKKQKIISQMSKI